MKEKLNRLYDDMAWIWPVMSLPEHYREESEFYARIIMEMSGGKAKTVLNLGTGGGHNDSHLKRIFRVTGVDASVKMLELAKKLNPEVEYHHADMRSVRLNRIFDAVIIFDSIVYMLTDEDLQALFRTAAEHLESGGIVVAYHETLREYFREYTRVDTNTRDNMTVSYVEHCHDPAPDDETVQTDLVYIIHRDNRRIIETDLHITRIIHLQQLLDIIKSCGFETRLIPFDIPDITEPGTDAYPLIIGRKN